MSLLQEIRRRKEDARNKLDQLKELNVELLTQRKTLENDLDVALFEDDKKNIDLINAELVKVTIEMQSNDRHVQLIHSGNDPIINKMVVSAVDEFKKENILLEESTLKELKMLERKRNELLKDMKKVVRTYKKINRHNSYMDSLIRELTWEERRILNLIENGHNDSIARKLNNLLISHGELYND